MISRKLEYLIALAKEGHFARAAAACRVSQPALSAGIQQLEHELSVQIVKRGQRFQGFTEQGEIVLGWAQRMDAECKRLHQELRDNSDHLAGTLRIGVLNSTAPFAGLFTIPFAQRFPEVNLRIMQHNAFEIQQGLEEGAFDVAISFLAPSALEDRTGRDEKLRDDKPGRYRHWHALYTHEYYALVRKGHKFSGRASISWEELQRAPLCLYPAETQVLGAEISTILASGHPGINRLETDSMYVLLDHVRTGNWVSILPTPVLFMIAGGASGNIAGHTSSHSSNDSDFEAIPLPRTAEGASVGIVVPHQVTESPLADAFFEVATSNDVLDKFKEFFQPLAAASRR